MKDLLRHKGAAEALGAVSAALSLDASSTLISADKMTEGATTATDPAVGVAPAQVDP